MRHTHLLPIVALSILAALPTALIAGCGSGSQAAPLPDTINVATLYGPASYFMYRDTIMGYDYELMNELAQQHHHTIHWVVVPSVDSAVNLVHTGAVALVCAPLPTTDRYPHPLLFCGPEQNIEQVLVQPPGDTVVVDVSQLSGRIVYVEKDSKGALELERLNRTLGTNILVRPVDPDSLATEDMLASVAKGDIPLAVVDRRTARLNKSYFPELNITLALSQPAVARWAVTPRNRALADSINLWVAEPHSTARQSEILKKYFDSQKNFPIAGAKYDRNFNNGYASPFDHLFRRHTQGSNWDWRMLAAQAYQESRFDTTATSWAGARGLMQIMPGTARDFGLKKNEMNDPSRSIETAVKILDRYDAILAPLVPDPIERQKFVLAAYNAGPGHVLDAIRLAKKHGYDHQTWNDNVEKAMLMKMNRKYYRDPVVKHGYSRGRETVDYVRKIYNYYDEVRNKIPH